MCAVFRNAECGANVFWVRGSRVLAKVRVAKPLEHTPRSLENTALLSRFTGGATVLSRAEVFSGLFSRERPGNVVEYCLAKFVAQLREKIAERSHKCID